MERALRALKQTHPDLMAEIRIMPSGDIVIEAAPKATQKPADRHQDWPGDYKL
jgi:hypothetical protein